jgi:hypothetical protein
MSKARSRNEWTKEKCGEGRYFIRDNATGFRLPGIVIGGNGRWLVERGGRSLPAVHRTATAAGAGLWREWIAERLARLRRQLQSETISHGGLHELQCLSRYIRPGDVELLEPAGVPESMTIG